MINFESSRVGQTPPAPLQMDATSTTSILARQDGTSRAPETVGKEGCQQLQKALGSATTEEPRRDAVVTFPDKTSHHLITSPV